SDSNALPSFVASRSVVTTVYDGGSDDLLTGGLGAAGLGGELPGNSPPPPPGFANPANPTAAELRKRAIYANYRALVDPTFNGGYGTLYGPNVDVNGTPTLNPGKIAGEEWLAYDDDGSGRVNVTMMVQVPDSFDANNPCIVTAASSGSRGVYGAIATAGEWCLKPGCAVAYAGPDVERGRKYHAGQILTIAASVSNGGGSSLAAVEQDSQHWISGVVAGEPQIQVQSTSPIQRGGSAVAAKGKPLYEYMTLA